MKLISHRGNIDGIIKEKENHPDYILNAIKKYNYDVEVDVRFINKKIYLGHDNPEWEIKIDFFTKLKNKLYLHCKNIEALLFFSIKKNKCFYHFLENHTPILNTNLIWTHNLKETTKKSIIPLLNKKEILKWKKYSNAFGFCSDYIKMID